MLKFTRRFLSTNSVADRAIIVEKLNNGIVTLAMNRPKTRNAISKLFLQQLDEAINEN
jgi:enoyl-CoA hydratase/carnithine racemase